jgi:hypothetical protein
MAMHKPRKQMRFQDGGDVNEAEMKRRGLDISNRARKEGTEKTGFFQRLREGNIDDPNSAAYKKYGAGRARLDDQIKAGELKLADDVQKKVKDDADFAEADRVSSTARAVAGKPAAKTTSAAKSGIVTKEELKKSGLSLRDYMNKQKGLTRRGGAASAADQTKSDKFPKASGAMIQSMDTDMMRTAGRTAAKEQGAKYAADRKKSANQAAFERAQAEAKTPEGKAKLDERIKGQALERVSPEEYIGPAFGLKTLSKLAKKLATPKVKEYKPTMLPAPKAASKTDTKALESPRPKLSYDKRGMKEKERANRAAKREKEKDSDNIQRGGRLTGGREIELKKGGSVSSASKRADGIAQRGKTRGKVY